MGIDVRGAAKLSGPQKMKNSSCVLVTGGTGTLGSALVCALTEAGFPVAVNYWHNQQRALALQQKAGCELKRGDVSDEKGIDALFAGHNYRAVFHLAGAAESALLPRVSASAWQAQLKINAQSAFLITRAALQNLPRGGHLILVSSRVAERGSSGQSAYGAGKAAVLGLMKAAALEAKPLGISVNAICPGFAPSALSDGLSGAVLDARAAENAIPGADAAQSFAALCVWILNSPAPISGRILRPDCRF